MEVKGIPPRHAGEASVIVTLSLDLNGILEVRAEIKDGYEAVTTKIDYELKFDYDNKLEVVSEA